MKFFHNRWFQISIILLATTIAYINIFGNGFVIDDRYFIEEWSLTRSWANVGQLLAGAHPESQPGVYRPIRSLLYLVYYQLWGTNPTGYHLHSLLVHLLATTLVFGVIREIGGMGGIREKKNNIAAVAALLFGLHPIHTESITYIAASMEMTGAVFFLASFWLYLVAPSLRGARQSADDAAIPFGIATPFGLAMTTSMVFSLLAYFTYEMTLTLPLLLMLYEKTLGKLGKLGELGRKLWPYFAGAALFFLVRFGAGVGLGRGEYLAYSFFHTQLTMAKMWVKYLLLLLWPVTLSHNHTVVPGFEAFMTPYSDQAAILGQSILDPEILLSITIITIIIVIAVIFRKKQPTVAFSLGWFFISMLPVAYFFPQGTAIAEKYLYIASFGFVLVLSWAFYNVYSRYNRYKHYIFLIVVMAAILYGVRTVVRNQDWSSPRSLWEYEARIHPTSELAFYNLGIIYGEAGEKEKATAAYTKAIALEPRFWEARHNLKNLQKL